MPRTRQGHVSLPDSMWNWIYEKHSEYGYRFHSGLVEYCIKYAIEHDPKFKENPDAQFFLEEQKKADRIGEIAKIRRGRKFSLVTAVRDYEEDVKGIDALHKKGWITDEEKERLIKESEEQHREVVRTELSKEKKKEPKKKKKKHDLAWYKKQMRKTMEKPKIADKGSLKEIKRELKARGLSMDYLKLIKDYAEDEGVSYWKAFKVLVPR